MSSDISSFTKLLEKKPETINAFGCTFSVYRSNKDKGKRVISVSLWKGSPGYLFSLQTSLLEWIRIVREVFKGWYIRFYVDANIFRPFTPETRDRAEKELMDIEKKIVETNVGWMINSLLEKEQFEGKYDLWDALGVDKSEEIYGAAYDEKMYRLFDFDNLLKLYLSSQINTNKSIEGLIKFIMEQPIVYEYIKPIVRKRMNYIESYNLTDIFQQLVTKHLDVAEVWFYHCQWGYSRIRTSDPTLQRHLNTFGSIVRFHPFDDNDVDIILVRNLEALSSQYDKMTVDRWLKSGKTFCLYSFSDYICGIHDMGVYNETCKELNGEIMILAMINYNKKSRSNLFKNCMTYDFMIDLIRKTSNQYLKDFVYGVDEVILTRCVKPYLKKNSDDFEIVYITRYFNYKKMYGEEAYKQFIEKMKSNEAKTPLTTEGLQLLEEKKRQYRDLFLNNDKDYFPDPKADHWFSYYNIASVQAMFPGLAFKVKTLKRVGEEETQAALKYHFYQGTQESSPKKAPQAVLSAERTGEVTTFYRKKYLKYKQKYLSLKNRLY